MRDCLTRGDRETLRILAERGLIANLEVFPRSSDLTPKWKHRQVSNSNPNKDRADRQFCLFFPQVTPPNDDI